MALKRTDEVSTEEKKKKKRVGFFENDPGVEANECINIFLVGSAEEIDAPDHTSTDPIDLNQFFGEDGKIYGYKGLKVDVWLSLVSFHAYADISFEATEDGGKGVTELEPCLQKIFGESLIEKEEFTQSFASKQHHLRDVVSKGKIVLTEAIEEGDGSSKVEVIQMSLENLEVATLYSRLVPFLLLFVEGSSPVDITDPCWDIYFAVKTVPSEDGSAIFNLLGFSTVYSFYRYPDTTRLRISQILVLPPFQGQGHGHFLLEAINSVAISNNLYDVTAEEPSDYLRSLRLCMDSLRLLRFAPVTPSIESTAQSLRDGPNNAQLAPPADLLEDARSKLKISRKQFLRCWEILIYLALERDGDKSRERFRSWVSGRVRNEILGKDSGGMEKKKKQLVEVDSEYNSEMSFVVFVGPNGSEPSEGTKLEPEQEQQMEKVVDEEMEEIASIAGKVSSFQN